MMRLDARMVYPGLGGRGEGRYGQARAHDVVPAPLRLAYLGGEVLAFLQAPCHFPNGPSRTKLRPCLATPAGFHVYH